MISRWRVLFSKFSQFHYLHYNLALVPLNILSGSDERRLIYIEVVTSGQRSTESTHLSMVFRSKTA